MHKWEKIKLEYLASDTKNAFAMGPFGSNITADNFVNEGVPVIRGQNLKDGARFYLDNFVYLTEEKADKLRASNAFPDDLVFTHRGTLGQVGIIPSFPYRRYVVSQSQMKVSLNKELVYPLYLYYYFCSIGKYELLKYTSGSGVPAIGSPLTTLKSLKIDLPPLPTQKKIANILSAYDDLIENNNQRIQLLEEMAAEIYKEWFVRFRFPGYESATFVDKEGKEVPQGTDGALPLGWERMKLGDVAEISSSKRIFSSDYVSSGVPFYRGKEITLKSKNKALTDILYISRNKFNEIKTKFGVPKKGDILITAVGTLGSTYLVTNNDGDFYFKDGNLIWLKGNENYSSQYLVQYLRSIQFQLFLQGIAIGSSQKALTIASLKDVEFLNPSKSICRKIDDLLKPISEEIDLLRIKNETLQQTRDLLLPRLISGKLSVENLALSTIEEVSTVSS